MTDEARSKVCKVGDWVRFQRGGELVIAKVEYLRPAKRWPNDVEVVTDLGTTHADHIVEVR
jgi:hypothetical protein